MYNFPTNGHAVRLGVIALFLAACSDSTVAPASEPEGGAQPHGEIRGSVGDREHTWNTLMIPLGNEVRSTANYASVVGSMTSYTLQGHTGNTFDIKDSLSITFSMQGDRILSSGTLFFPKADMFPHYGDHEDSVEVVIETIGDADGSRRVVGRAEGTLYRLDSYSSEPDSSDRIDVSVRFDTLVEPE